MLRSRPLIWIGLLVFGIVIFFLSTVGTISHGPNDEGATTGLADVIAYASSLYYQEYQKAPPSLENHRLVATLMGDNPRKKVFYDFPSGTLSQS